MARSEDGLRLPLKFIAAGILLGLGLGGFVDGIVLHQILQWHHMVSAVDGFPTDTVAGLEDNSLWDGLFHTATWLMTVAGVVLLWNSVPVHRPGWGWILFGLIVAGWGVFNLADGIVDHHILGIHHVRDDVENKLPWDLAFLASGVLLLGLGLAIVRFGRDRALRATRIERADRREMERGFDAR